MVFEMNESANTAKQKRRGNDSDALEFLPAALEIAETPPRALGRISALVIGFFFVAAIVWASVSPIDIVAVAEGRIVPTGQIKIVQPFQSGIVRAIHVVEGKHVNAGDILIELDATEAETNRVRAELELARAELDHAAATALLTDAPDAQFVAPNNVDERLVELSENIISERWANHQSSLEDNDAENKRILSSIVTFEAEEKAIQRSVGEFEELNASAKKLDEAGLATQSQLANMRLQLISTQTQLQNATQQITQSKFELKRNEAQRQQIGTAFRGKVNAELAAARQSILIANEELLRLREREELHHLRAPVSGIINEVLVHTVGAVVSPSEKLLTIVPEGVLMEIEAILENRDVGFVEVGQDVEIKLEAFPFTRFGVINGTVTHLSPDAVIDPTRGPVYTIRVAPVDQVHNAGGQEIHLSPGMRTTVEIKTGKRTVMEFFLAPLLRYRDEAIRER